MSAFLPSPSRLCRGTARRGTARGRALLPLAALALGIRLALHVVPADAQATAAPAHGQPDERATLSLVLFDAATPLPGVEVRIDGVAVARTGEDGTTRLAVTAGQHALSAWRDGTEVLSLALQLRAGESIELIATLYPDAAPSVFVESSHGAAQDDGGPAPTDTAGPPGVLEGSVLGSEDGRPVADARIYVSGTPIDLVTDAAGSFRAELPAGSYSVSVIAAGFSTQTLDAVAIDSERTTLRRIELTPAGLELPEFVVLAPYVEGSLAAFVEEKRSSAAISDILGAEQISRAGDSDAAGALKRVTGLTLVDGKFVYVRGLGERYSSALLNGAQIPSPDPTRRVVPLDLFPTELLSGIVVQKTWSADMPGEFAGGTVQLRTRGVPESFVLRAQGSVGYADGSTGSDGLRYDGGDRDWLGVDDGRRAAPPLLTSPAPLPPGDSSALEALGEELAGQGYAIEETGIGPNTGTSFAIGDDFRFNDGAWSLGYLGALRYAQSWDSVSEQRRDFSLQADGSLVPITDIDRRRTERAIDTGVFFALGATIGEHHELTATALQVRQSTDEARIDEGLSGSGAVERQTQLEWVENELLTWQLGGEHSLPALGGLRADWLFSRSAASRDAPNTREARYQFSDADQAFRFFGVDNRFDALDDDVDEARIDLRYPFEFGETASLELQAGGSSLERERSSDIWRFTFGGGRPGNIPFLPIEQILSPPNIGPDFRNQLRLQRNGRPTDFYTATQQLDGTWLTADARWGDWRANLGARRERNLQQVVTQPPNNPNSPPQVALIETDDLLPGVSVTFAYSDAAQLRMAYSETVNRPDFRELSPSFFTDPLLDVTTGGNPDLQPAAVTNLDLRWEYYFSSLESFSVALFRKTIDDPIEVVRQPGSGFLLTLENGTVAENTGIEFDVYRGLATFGDWQRLPGLLQRLPWDALYLGANYTRIESEVDLGDARGIQTNNVRPLQGQSPYVANLSLSYLPEHGRTEAALLYNVSGERIALVGVNGLPDVYEQPFHQLDLSVSTALPWEGWKAKLRLRNLLDPSVEFTQGDEVQRSYRKGREIAVSLEWRY